MMPPSSWLITPSGLTTRPASVAHQTRCKRISSSTESSTTTAEYAARFLYRAKPIPRPRPVPPAASEFHHRHGGDFFDDGAGAWISGDRKTILNRVLSSPFREFVDAGFEGEHVGHRAKPAQGRGAHRWFGYQMVESAFGGNVVERLGIAGRAAAVRFRDVVRGRLRRRIGQGERAQQISARPGTQIVGRAPDFLRPVDWLSSLIKYRAHLHNHRRRLRLVDKFFLSTPANANGPTGLLHGDDRGIGGSVVGPVVPVATGALHVVHNDRGVVEREHFRQGSSQRVYALAMRPNGQSAVLVE